MILKNRMRPGTEDRPFPTTGAFFVVAGASAKLKSALPDMAIQQSQQNLQSAYFINIIFLTSVVLPDVSW